MRVTSTIMVRAIVVVGKRVVVALRCLVNLGHASSLAITVAKETKKRKGKELKGY